MANLQIFKNDRFGQVRIQMNASDEPLFCANDVCSSLGYKNSRDAISKHVDADDVAKCDTLTKGGIQSMSYVNESGLYSLIFGSKLEEAKLFKKWVTSDVLPTIRKTGSYSINHKPKREPSLTTKVRVGLEWVKGVSDMLNLNDASKLQLLGKVAEPLNLPLPDYVTAKGVPFSSTILLERFGVNVSAREFNKKMKEAGMIENRTRPTSHGKVKNFPILVGRGLEYGENAINPNCQNQTQPRYYEETFEALLSELKFPIENKISA